MKSCHGLQIFDLSSEKEAKKYFAVLKYALRNKTKVPVVAKGMMRMIDFTKKLAKLDFYPPFETAWTKQEKLMLGNFLSGQ